MRFLSLLAAALLVTAPLRAQVSTPTRAAASLPSIALPPALDRVLRDYERDWRAGNARALAELFTPDGFVLSNGQPPVRGRDAIRRAYEGQSGPLTLRALAYATADTVGYIIGAYTYDSTAGDQGKFTLTLRRGRDRRWLIASDMDNPIRPPRAAPASGTPPSPSESPAAP
jgi:uncharacterized protein (TIGR02246 family)